MTFLLVRQTPSQTPLFTLIYDRGLLGIGNNVFLFGNFGLGLSKVVSCRHISIGPTHIGLIPHRICSNIAQVIAKHLSATH